jgi:hypothetical protein
MNLLELLNDIGEDADLLTRSDDWLEQERRSVAADLDTKARELEKILMATRIKRLLQQKNLVAVQQLLKNADGETKDIIIRLMKLPDAMSLMEQPADTLDEVNAAAQCMTWEKDGYDLSTSRALRTA